MGQMHGYVHECHPQRFVLSSASSLQVVPFTTAVCFLWAPKWHVFLCPSMRWPLSTASILHVFERLLGVFLLKHQGEQA
jgi:hypothetical protein